MDFGPRDRVVVAGGEVHIVREPQANVWTFILPCAGITILGTLLVYMVLRIADPVYYIWPWNVGERGRLMCTFVSFLVCLGLGTLIGKRCRNNESQRLYDEVLKPLFEQKAKD